jgi:hypothetical protein
VRLFSQIPEVAGPAKEPLRAGDETLVHLDAD